MNIKEKLASINKVLPALVLGEVIYLIVGEIIILFLPFDKVTCMIGLAIGVCLAMAYSIHSAVVLNNTVTGEVGNKKGPVIIGYIIRLVVTAGVVVLAYFLKFANPVAILVGLISIQAGVFIVPKTEKKKKISNADDGWVDMSKERRRKAKEKPQEVVEESVRANNTDDENVRDNKVIITNKENNSVGSKIIRKRLR